MSSPGSVGGGKITPNKDNNMMTINSGIIVPQLVENTIRGQSELNAAITTRISPTGNIGASSSVTERGTSPGNNKGDTTNNRSSVLNVNNILADADNAAIAAQTITLTQQGTTSGSIAAASSVTADAAVENSNAALKGSLNGNATNGNNLNHYVLASTVVHPASNTGVPARAGTYDANISNNNPSAPVVTVTAPTSTVDPNSTASAATNQHLQSALLQQNAAIMQQNAATLQHLQNLHQTNKLLAANPGALGMLAPMMNMNLAATAATTNPVKLLATPPLAANPAAFLPATLPAPADLNGGPIFATPSVSSIQQPQQQPQQQQLQQQQQSGIPISAAPTIAIAAAGAPTTFPVAGFSNNGIVDTSSSNDAVQNILRTTFLLQANSGLPFLQQGTIPQQQQLQQVIPAQAASGGLMFVQSNTSNTNSAAPLGIIPGTAPAPTSDANGTDTKRIDLGNHGPTSGAAAAANAAASVLPPASMNLPLQQQLQQQQQQKQQFPPTPQMGIDLTSNNSANNAIALLGAGATLNNSNNLQIAGLATLQQQQRNQAMGFPSINISDPHAAQLQLPLAVPHHQKQQLVNPSAIQLTSQQRQATPKKASSIVRPLYLDHDSNCLTAYQCFLRKQIELFEVGHDEMTGTAQGRNTPLSYGQVGIRCRHCAHLPKSARARGGVYYSRTIDGVYQVAQNMSKLHFLKACTLIPDSTKNQLKSLQSVSSRASGGKEYWAEGLRVLGIIEEGGMLRFASNSSRSSSTKRTNKPTE